MRLVLATGYAELPKDVDVPFVKLAKPFRQAEFARAIAEAPKAATLTERIVKTISRATILQRDP